MQVYLVTIKLNYTESAWVIYTGKILVYNKDT